MRRWPDQKLTVRDPLGRGVGVGFGLATTFHGDLYALDAATGAILFKTPMSAGSNAPVAVDGDYVIAGAGAALPPTQRDMIIAYKLGATGKLPDTVGS